MQGEPSKPLSRRGIKLTPLVLSLPLAVLGVVLVYLGLAMLVGWDRPTLDKLVAAEQQEIGLEDSAPPTSQSSEKKSDEDEEPLAVDVAALAGLPIEGLTVDLAQAMRPFDLYFGQPSDRVAIALRLELGGYTSAIQFYSAVLLAVGLFSSLIAIVGFFACPLGVLRNRWALLLTRTTYVLAYVVGVALIVAFWNVARFLETQSLFGEFGKAKTTVPRLDWWYELSWPVMLAMLVVALFHFHSHKALSIFLYTGHELPQAAGDRFFTSVRTGGEDPQYRKSWVTSIFVHIFILIILPWLLGLGGCVEDYRVPKGSGQPVVAMVRIVKPKKVVKKTYILNPHSAISFYVPNLDDDSEIEEQIKEMIENQYEATNAMAGKMGAGGGTTGGWPDGMEDHEVRFIRLSYNGPGWDDGMGVKEGRADMNFLDEFQKQTGFNIRHHSESHPIHYLAKYRKGYAPPFVYMTGDGGISTNRRDEKILREYLEGGGMLFADAGYPNFHSQFVGFMRRVFPTKRMNIIADDDPLFQMPYRFANGPPPLWHHGGNRCLGIKYKGRWCVFYHPGDINDAWKTGHSGIGPSAARGAYQVGINVIYYSFTNYLELTKKYRR